MCRDQHSQLLNTALRAEPAVDCPLLSGRTAANFTRSVYWGQALISDYGKEVNKSLIKA